jgi:hypothetical protein
VPLDLLAAQAAWQSTAFRLLFPLAIFELFFFPALSLLPGLNPAHYIVTFTKDFNLRFGDAEAIQYWVYSVEHNSATLIDKQSNVPTIK